MAFPPQPQSCSNILCSKSQLPAVCFTQKSIPCWCCNFFRFYISGLKRCSALSDVSTLSFPLQSRRIRSRSCEDRSLGWTQSSCRADRSFWFNINLPPMQQLLTLMLCLCSCTRAEKGRKLLPCAFVLEQWGQNGIKTRFLTLLSCISGLEFLPWHLNMAFNLTFNH